MSKLEYRELHTCPKCGTTEEINFRAIQMQSVICRDCTMIEERQQVIDDAATAGMTMIEAIDYFESRPTANGPTGEAA